MKSRLILLFIAALLILVACFGYPVLKNRYLKNATEEIINNNPIQKFKEDMNAENQNQDSSQNNSQETRNTIAPDIEVTPKDCDNNCSKFKENNEKEYCREICGTENFFENASEEGGSSDDCASEKGVQKDYCLKDIAVGNKDFKACDEIKDSNIKKSCQNRITEDLLEEQQNESEPVL